MKRMLILFVLILIFISGCGKDVDFKDCKAIAENTTEIDEVECMLIAYYNCIPAKGIGKNPFADKVELTVYPDCSVHHKFIEPVAGLEELEGTEATCPWDNTTKKFHDCEGEAIEILVERIDDIEEMLEE